MVERLIGELRLLRRIPGPLSPSKIVAAPAVLKGLGGGDPDVALHRLLLLRRQHASDREVEAAFASMGDETNGESVLERLDEFAAGHYVDSRTARRWSDAGIERLASLILTDAPWIDPQAELQLDIDGDRVVGRIRFTVPSFIGMRLPTLTRDGGAIPLQFDRITRAGERDQMFGATVVKFVPGLATNLMLNWRGEIVPTYIVDASLGTDWRIRSLIRLYALEVRLRHVDGS